MGLRNVLHDRLGRDDSASSGDYADGNSDAAEAGDFSPGAFRDHAADLVDRLEDDALDGSLASLDALDDCAAAESDRIGAVADELDDQDALVEQVHGAHTLEYGSYFGEVLVRAFDGEWEREDGIWKVRTAAGSREVRIVVFDVAAQSVAGSPTFATVADDLEESLEQADSAGVTAVPAERAEEFAAEWPSRDLDLTPASLVRLDELVDEEWPAEQFRGVDFGDGDGEPAATYTSLVEGLGSYFGEVLAGHLGGEWHRNDEGRLVHVVASADGEAELAPVAIAADCLAGEDSFTANYEALRGRLSIDAPPAEE